MNWQTALILFAMVSPAIVLVMIAKKVSELRRKQMWWLILGLVVIALLVWWVNNLTIT